MPRNTQRKFNSNRTRKGKARDISLPLPDYTNTFLGAIRSAAGGIHYNIEIMHHDKSSNTWRTEPAMATLRGGIRKAFFRKDLPQQLSERIILVEQTELLRQTGSTSSGPGRKMCLIIHCYTVNEIRQLADESLNLLPPNLISYTDSTRTALGDKVDLGDTDEVIIDFTADGGAAADDGDDSDESDDEKKGSNSDDEDDDEILRNPNSSIDMSSAKEAAIAAAVSGTSGRKKKSGKSAPEQKKRVFKKKHGGGGGGGGVDFASI
jgi:hypothetical protein